MGSECNLDLCLVPAGIEPNAPSSIYVESRSEESMMTQSSHELTIFYNGWISVCNVTESQAEAILRIASREVDKKMEANRDKVSPSQCRRPPSRCELQATAGASTVKRSLQRFLQKRMSRIHSTSPYSG